MAGVAPEGVVIASVEPVIDVKLPVVTVMLVPLILAPDSVEVNTPETLVIFEN